MAREHYRMPNCGGKLQAIRAGGPLGGRRRTRNTRERSLHFLALPFGEKECDFFTAGSRTLLKKRGSLRSGVLFLVSSPSCSAT